MGMKKLYLSGILLTGCVLSGYSDYLPVLEVGKSWIVAQKEDHYGDVSFFKIKVVRESLINGRKYRLETWSVDQTAGEWVENELIRENLAVEEDGVVYHINPLTGEKDVLFSLNLQVGDPVSEAHENECRKVTARFEQAVADEMRTCIYAGSFTTGHDAWIIEGIGSSVSLWQSTAIPTCDDWTFHYMYMVECRKDDVCLFAEKDFNNIAVPGNAKIDTIVAEEEASDQASGPMYNLQGIAITHPVPGGIYIQNGKKIRYTGSEGSR